MLHSFVYLCIITCCCSLQVPQKVIAVVGANGKTGRKVVDLSLTRDIETVAITRTGLFDAVTSLRSATKSSQIDKLKVRAADVTDPATLVQALKGVDACIFAASASKEGGTADEVDRTGLINVALACLENNVPRLVVVSSGAVTKPWSPVYLFLNLFGGIMRAKIEGENEVRRLYAGRGPGTDAPSYTIIRPGGLLEDPPLGCSAIELNQGDVMSGRISRWDVAELCVECIDSKDAFNTTYECYYKETAQPLSNVGFSNMFRRTNTAGDRIQLSGRERSAATYPALFRGLTRDV